MMTRETLPLFSFDLHRMGPAAYDAACKGLERSLRDEGSFDHLERSARKAAIIKAASKALPWSAQRCGHVTVGLEGNQFVARIYLADDLSEHVSTSPSPLKLKGELEVGTLDAEPEKLRQALVDVVAWVAAYVPRTVFVDSEHYEMLLEHFDLKRFRTDFRSHAPGATVAERSRYWN